MAWIGLGVVLFVLDVLFGVVVGTILQAVSGD